MDLRYILVIITLKNINCYSPNRLTQTSSTSNFNNLKSKTTDPVIPARYKIKSTTDYRDPTITHKFPAEYFPEVEYPESVVDSSKPFYLSASPFPNDVKSTFNSFVAKGNSKAKSAINYSWTQKEKSIENMPATLQKLEENEITDTKGNGINVIDKEGNGINNIDKETIETLHEDISMIHVRDDIENEEIPNSDSDMDKMFTNWTSIEQSADCKDMDYVVGFINDLDQVMKNLTSTETPDCNEGGNSMVHTFESECSNEFKLNSDMTPNNNDSIVELNGNLFHKEEHPDRIRNPLFEDSDTNYALTSLSSLLNEYRTNVTSVEDMQSDFCSIGPIANETNTCTAS